MTLTDYREDQQAVARYCQAVRRMQDVPRREPKNRMAVIERRSGAGLDVHRVGHFPGDVGARQ